MLMIKSITINHAKKQIVLTRVLNYTNTGLSAFHIPDEIEGNCVELQDPIEFGSSLLYPHAPSFPSDLNLYKGQTFKFQLHDSSQITGELIGYKDKCIVVDVQLFHTSEASKNKTLPKGKLSINEDLIAAYFANDLVKEKLTKIVLSNISVSREITVTYNIPITATTNLGYFTHTIKGIYKKQIYTNPNLEADIPITIDTEYNWMPLWNTFEEGITVNPNLVGETKTLGGPDEVCGVQLNIISETKQKYTVESFVGYKHYLNKIPINSLNTKCTRAVLVHPVGPIQIALYFKNNSTINLIKSQIIVIDQEDIVQYGSANNSNNNNNNNSNRNNDFGDQQKNFIGKPQPNQRTTQPFSLPQTKQIKSILGSNEPTFSFLKEVKSGEIGIILMSIFNDQIQIYKDIAHQPLWETKTREFNVGEIKISNIFTLMDALTLNKINYRFVNATPYNTNFIVYVGSNSKQSSNTTTGQPLTFGAPATTIVTTTTPEGTEFENKSTVKVKSIGNNDQCQMIGESLYLFNSTSLSINTFEMSYSTKKQFMTNSKLPQVLINYLDEKGIKIRYNPDKFETYDLSHLDNITQDTIVKLMANLHLEERTSNYFTKSYPTGDISNFLFEEHNTGFQGAYAKSGLFGSANYYNQPQHQQQSSSFGGFGQSHQTTSGFSFGGNTAANNTTAFGQPQSSSCSPFGQPQPQQPSSFGGFGQSQQTTSGFSFGSPTATTPTATGGLFGQPQQTTGGLFGQAQQTTGGLFGQTQQTTTSPQPSTFKFTPTTSPQPTGFGFSAPPPTSPQNNVVGDVNIQSISAQPQYKDLSVEEIRYKEQQNKK